MTPGVEVELKPHDYVASSVLYYGLPDWPEMPFLLHYLRAGDQVIDVGANVGLYSVLAASVPGVRVVAFEPNAVARERAMANAARNHMSDRIAVRPQAVGDTPGRASFTVALGSGNRLVEASAAATLDVQDVEVVALDESVEGPVAFIKVDVEGAEAAVLEGASQILQASQPVLVVEANDPGALTELLEPLGYQWVAYDPAERRLVATGPPERGRNGIAVADLPGAADRVARR